MERHLNVASQWMRKKTSDHKGILFILIALVWIGGCSTLGVQLYIHPKIFDQTRLRFLNLYSDIGVIAVHAIMLQVLSNAFYQFSPIYVPSVSPTTILTTEFKGMYLMLAVLIWTCLSALSWILGEILYADNYKTTSVTTSFITYMEVFVFIYINLINGLVGYFAQLLVRSLWRNRQR